MARVKLSATNLTVTITKECFCCKNQSHIVRHCRKRNDQHAEPGQHCESAKRNRRHGKGKVAAVESGSVEMPTPAHLAATFAQKQRAGCEAILPDTRPDTDSDLVL